MRSLYAMLNVDRRATAKEIKRAYYALAHDCHPDKFPGDEQAAQHFRDISLAYTVLGDAKSRKRYDVLGPMALGLPVSLTDLSVLGSEGEQLAQALGTVMSGMLRRLRSRKNSSKPIDMHIDAVMALTGGERQLQLQRRRPCPHCQRLGEPRGGRTLASEPSSALLAPCVSCRGKTTVPETVTVRLRIPADSAPNDQLRLAGAGSMGADIRVRLIVDPHPSLLCRNLDLFVELAITAAEAALGASVRLQLPHKELIVHLAAGSQTGDVIMLPQEGLRGGRLQQRGSLHITVDVKIPTRLSAEAQALWQALHAQEQHDGAGYVERARFFRQSPR